jgi:DNA-directed RNA polymerase II subunit RPB2
MDHEVLTYDGWKFYDQLKMTDKIATLKNGKLVYEEPTELIYYPDFSGQLYSIKSDQIDLIVTTNHRMYVSENGIDFELIKADEIIGKKVQYKKNADWYGSRIASHKFMDVVKQTKMKDMRNIPNIVWECNMVQCREILDSITSDKSEYYTSVNSFADDMMKLALHCGWSANKESVSETLWKIVINRDDNVPYVNTLYDKFKNMCSTYLYNTSRPMEEVYTSTEPVFCLQVPSEVFYVRRNGRSVWTGNSRSRGPTTSLTHQAPEGRSRDGGLRLGEMERDALLAHGLAKFIKEKLMDNSDPYVVWVCDKCGLFAERFDRKENKSEPSDDDIYYCPACNNHTEISKLRIPYAFKLFLHEMMAMCIAPRIRCNKTIYNS